LPIDSMIHNAKADDAVARALLAKGNPVLAHDRAEVRAEGRIEGKAEGRIEGKAEGKAEALIMVLIARGVVLDSASRTRILGEHDSRQLDRWIARAATCATIDELFSTA
jgi:hypothetical protein